MPVVDQQGPFKADCAGQLDGAGAQPDGQCSGWRGLWFDYNVEMNYYMMMKAGLDEALLSLNLSNLLYMENPYSYKKYQ